MCNDAEYLKKSSRVRFVVIWCRSVIDLKSIELLVCDVFDVLKLIETKG